MPLLKNEKDVQLIILVSHSYIGDCCQGLYSRCVIMGAKDAELTTFPREAMKELQPYPFGFDPVS